MEAHEWKIVPDRTVFSTYGAYWEEDEKKEADAYKIWTDRHLSGLVAVSVEPWHLDPTGIVRSEGRSTLITRFNDAFLRWTTIAAYKKSVSDLLKTAGTEDWDGEGGTPVREETVSIAKDLIDHLPSYAQGADINATAQGEIDLDWCLSRNVMLTISVLPSSDIAFAGLFEGASISGQEKWSGVLPKFVRCSLERLKDYLSE